MHLFQYFRPCLLCKATRFGDIVRFLMSLNMYSELFAPVQKHNEYYIIFGFLPSIEFIAFHFILYRSMVMFTINIKYWYIHWSLLDHFQSNSFFQLSIYSISHYSISMVNHFSDFSNTMLTHRALEQRWKLSFNYSHFSSMEGATRKHFCEQAGKWM